MRRSTSLPVPLPPLPVRRWWRRARRSPVAWWAAALLVAVLAAGQVAAADDVADARRRAWGTQRAVLVAQRALAPGDVLDGGDARVEERPAAMVPEGALDDLPAGRVVTHLVVPGEAIVEDRLAPAGLTGVAALLPDGHRAIAVPVAGTGFGGGFGTEAPPVVLGDRVDVLATFDVVDGDAPPTAPVARDALVVDIGERSVTVAVPEGDAGPVAFAVARGTVTLVLVGAG